MTISSPISLIITAIIGLIIGSFLNVVIVRLPIMLQQRWRQDCQRFLQLAADKLCVAFNLFVPRSHCRHCQTPIKIIHNIPLISYFFLRGHCVCCKKKISWRYPFIEFLTALLFMIVIFHFGLTIQSVALCVLTAVLIVLFFIDLDHQILPDMLTLGMLWLGLLLSLFYVFVTPIQAIEGAIVGYGLLWVIGTLFKLIRKKDGLGHGDYKMLALFGAWFGVGMALNILFLAVILGLLASLVLGVLKKISLKNPIPFGPALSVAGWITLFTGPWFIHFILAR